MFRWTASRVTPEASHASHVFSAPIPCSSNADCILPVVLCMDPPAALLCGRLMPCDAPASRGIGGYHRRRGVASQPDALISVNAGWLCPSTCCRRCRRRHEPGSRLQAARSTLRPLGRHTGAHRLAAPAPAGYSIRATCRLTSHKLCTWCTQTMSRATVPSPSGGSTARHDAAVLAEDASVSAGWHYVSRCVRGPILTTISKVNVSVATMVCASTRRSRAAPGWAAAARRGPGTARRA